MLSGGGVIDGRVVPAPGNTLPQTSVYQLGQEIAQMVPSRKQLYRDNSEACSTVLTFVWAILKGDFPFPSFTFTGFADEFVKMVKDAMAVLWQRFGRNAG